jgi:hypothetical protein
MATFTVTLPTTNNGQWPVPDKTVSIRVRLRAAGGTAGAAASGSSASSGGSGGSGGLTLHVNPVNVTPGNLIAFRSPSGSSGLTATFGVPGDAHYIYANPGRAGGDAEYVGFSSPSRPGSPGLGGAVATGLGPNVHAFAGVNGLPGLAGPVASNSSANGVKGADAPQGGELGGAGGVNPSDQDGKSGGISAGAGSAAVIRFNSEGNTPLGGPAQIIVEYTVADEPVTSISEIGASQLSIQRLAPQASANALAEALRCVVGLSGHVPSVGSSTRGVAGTSELSVRGLTPAVSLDARAQALSGSVSILGRTPVSSSSVAAAPAGSTLTLAGQAPVAAAGAAANPATDSLEVRGFAPLAEMAVSGEVQLGVGQLTITGRPVSCTAWAFAHAGRQQLSVSGYRPEVSTSSVSAAGHQTVEVRGFTVAAVASTLSQVGTGALSITGLSPSALATQVEALPIEPTPKRTITVKAEGRVLKVSAEDRRITTALESRELKTAGEQRRVTSSAERRQVNIGAEERLLVIKP